MASRFSKPRSRRTHSRTSNDSGQSHRVPPLLSCGVSILPNARSPYVHLAQLYSCSYILSIRCPVTIQIQCSELTASGAPVDVSRSGVRCGHTCGPRVAATEKVIDQNPVKSNLPSNPTWPLRYLIACERSIIPLSLPAVATRTLLPTHRSFLYHAYLI